MKSDTLLVTRIAPIKTRAICLQSYRRKNFIFTFINNFTHQMLRCVAYKAKLIILVLFSMARISSVFAFSYREYATGIEVKMTDTISYNNLWGADEPNSLKMLNLIYDPKNNLCPNGDFEIEGLANWTPITTGDVTIALQEENGNNVVAINRPTTGYGILSSDFIPVVCGYKYIILWLAKINENGYMPMLRISAYDYNKQFLFYSYQQHFPAYTSWKKYYAVIPPSCKAYYLKIELFLYNQGGTVYFDDIKPFSWSILVCSLMKSGNGDRFILSGRSFKMDASFAHR